MQIATRERHLPVLGIIHRIEVSLSIIATHTHTHTILVDLNNEIKRGVKCKHILLGVIYSFKVCI